MHLTAPLRAGGDPQRMSLWAGPAYALARAEGAEAVVRRVAAEAREALAAAAQRLG
jgi:nitronate monooxygenase